MQTTSRRTVLVAGGLCVFAVAALTVQGHAALPPQYDRWNEFAAVVGDNAIPRKLGIGNPADRIERIGDGSYRVHGGKCFVAVTLSRRAPVGPQGQVMVGGSVVGVAEVSEPRCG
jgi:hypothetical protein